MRRGLTTGLAALALGALVGCAGAVPAATPTQATAQKVGVMLDSGSENDKNFNEYTLKGARDAANEVGLQFSYVVPQSADDYDSTLESLIATERPDLAITVGFRMGDATARSARRHRDVHFTIVDTAYRPGTGCAETVDDCYTTEGGLGNVTSLMYAEDEAAYLAGVLAACMTQTGTLAVVAGQDIPPVVRLVTGFTTGARSFDPTAETLHQYVPDFNDPDTGRVVGQGFISDGADVIFAAGGNTGNGGLLAAHEAGVMAIGVDVDQYFSYPEVASSLLTSAVKNVDLAAHAAVTAFAEGTLEAGIRLGTLSNGGVGLAPYHHWEARIPQECKDAVSAAEEAVRADPTITGAK